MRLIHNISWAFVGNVVFAASKWLILILFTKMESLEQVGYFAYALAICAPIYSFSNLQMRGIQASDAQNDYLPMEYAAFRLLTSLIAFIFIVAFVVIVEHPAIRIFLIVACWKFVETLFDVIYGYFQKNENLKIVAISLCMKGIFGALICSLVMVLGCGMETALIGVTGSWAIIFLFYDLKKYIRLVNKNEEFRRIEVGEFYKCSRRLFCLGFPMGIVIFLHNINLNIPRYAIEILIDIDHVAIYASLAYVIIAGTTIVSAVGQSIIPLLSKYGLSQSSQFSALMWKSVGFVAIIGCAGIVVSYYVGEPILRALYSPVYAAHKGLFVAIMFSALCIYLTSITGCALTALREFKLQTGSTVVCFVLIASTCSYLTRNHGMIGSALSLSIGFGVSAALNMAILKFKIVNYK